MHIKEPYCSMQYNSGKNIRDIRTNSCISGNTNGQIIIRKQRACQLNKLLRTVFGILNSIQVKIKQAITIIMFIYIYTRVCGVCIKHAHAFLES
jgi:hypothetical protein